MEELAGAIRRRELTATEVVEGHIGRLVQFAPRVNAVAAARFELARAEAAGADALVASEDRDLPPLLGVPFTVKESIGLRDMPQSAGLLARKSVRARDHRHTPLLP